MFEALQSHLVGHCALVAERAEGVAFFLAARQLYRLKSISYVCINISVAERSRVFVHCVYSDTRVKEFTSKEPVRFELKNILDDSIMDASNAKQFDAIVFSEVLEHLDKPEKALRSLLHLCKPGGRVWINVPANSPAPDHLYLVREPKQAEDAVRAAGFEVVDTAHLPMTGVTLERAIEKQLTITCIIVGRRPLA